MTYCSNCEITEPKTRDASNGELLVMGLNPKEDSLVLCGECECLEETLVNVPEHDDGDER